MAKKRKRRLEPCEYCDGSLVPKRVSRIFNVRGHMALIERIPADVCTRCGERYFDGRIVRVIERLIAAPGRDSRRVVVPVLRYPA